MCAAFPTKRRRTGGSKTPAGSENGAVRWNGVVNKYCVPCKNDALESHDVRHNAATPRTQASAQRCVDLLERPCARAEVLLAELVERHRAGVEMSVKVFGVGREVEEAREDLALHGWLGDLVLGADVGGGVVAEVQFAQLDFTQGNRRRAKPHRLRELPNAYLEPRERASILSAITNCAISPLSRSISASSSDCVNSADRTSCPSLFQ